MVCGEGLSEPPTNLPQVQTLLPRQKCILEVKYAQVFLEGREILALLSLESPLTQTTKLQLSGSRKVGKL